ncbi:beta-lactamase class A [Kitasatospora sp. Ki12]|uniref:class A beta-lactamase n=1 Tax=Kitasatospora xanthocidica TaxID=83382 RepID=UPI001673D176|nr:class A beta-lactamase [Kitasatospora xanthocidica]GHF72462.1 beta-lactamase [Kitasatospora xanthocidica]
MHTQPSAARHSRRAVLGLGLGAAVAATGVTALTGGSAHAATGPDTRRLLAALEQEHGVRLGVFARNLSTGRTVRYRADEPFPMCSVFKTVAVAAVLRDLDHDGEFLARRIHYTEADITRSGGRESSLVTREDRNLANGMTVAELCQAAIDHSDNTAGNLLLRELGGPTAVTGFCRSIGDGVTRLDRWEPELNTAEPERTTDTTTPQAIARTYRRLVLGHALPPAKREQITGWLRGNTTSKERFRKGLPADWTLADKTGSGRYGTANDVGIAWTPAGAPVVLAVLTTKPDEAAPRDEPVIARTATLLAQALV